MTAYPSAVSKPSTRTKVGFGAWAVVAVEGNDGRQWGRIRPFGPGAPLPQLWDGVRPTHRARAAAAPPEACRHVPYIVLRLATLAPGSLSRSCHICTSNASSAQPPKQAPMVRRSPGFNSPNQASIEFSLTALLRRRWRVQCADGTGFFYGYPCASGGCADIGQSAARTL